LGPFLQTGCLARVRGRFGLSSQLHSMILQPSFYLYA